MTTAVVAIEGVLGEHDAIQGFHPIIEGMKLVRSLNAGYQCVFTTLNVDENSVDTWLMIAGLAKPVDYEVLVCRERRWADLDESTLRVEQVRDLRSRGYQLSLFVSADPVAVLQVTATGVPSLFYAHPAYGWEGFRSDRKKLPRSWQDIDDEITYQKQLKATDPRLTEIMED